MTSEDVVASLNRWRRVSPRAEMMAKVKDVVATDKHTVVFRLSAPLATLPFILSREGNQPVIHPKEIIENAPVNKLSAYVGTGPYRLGEWIPDRHIILERFPDYAARTEARGGMAGKKVAYLDRIVFRSIPESEVRLAGLRTGEFDGVQPLPQEYLQGAEGPVRRAAAHREVRHEADRVLQHGRPDEGREAPQGDPRRAQHGRHHAGRYGRSRTSTTSIPISSGSARRRCGAIAARTRTTRTTPRSPRSWPPRPATRASPCASSPPPRSSTTGARR